MINSKQRAKLRSLANPLESQFQIGKGEVDEKVIKSLDEFMTTHELVKITVLKTSEEDPKQVAAALASAVGAEVIQVIGRKLVFYRFSPKLAKLGKSLSIPY